MPIIAHISLSEHENKRTAKVWSGQTQDGYGRKMPTDRMVRYKNRWRRVYCCCYSNSGTCYITSGKDWIVVDD
jgi:hypothetical protein